MHSQHTWPLLQGFPPPSCLNKILSLPWRYFSCYTTMHHCLSHVLTSLPVQLSLTLSATPTPLSPSDQYLPNLISQILLIRTTPLGLLFFSHPIFTQSPLLSNQKLRHLDPHGCHSSPVESLTALSSHTDLTLTRPTYRPFTFSASSCLSVQPFIYIITSFTSSTEKSLILPAPSSNAPVHCKLD